MDHTRHSRPSHLHQNGKTHGRSGSCPDVVTHGCSRLALRHTALRSSLRSGHSATPLHACSAWMQRPPLASAAPPHLKKRSAYAAGVRSPAGGHAKSAWAASVSDTGEEGSSSSSRVLAVLGVTQS